MAVGRAAVPPSRQLDEQYVKRTETKSGVHAQATRTQSAFPVTQIQTRLIRTRLTYILSRVPNFQTC